MEIAADICIYTNDKFTVERLPQPRRKKTLVGKGPKRAEKKSRLREEKQIFFSYKTMYTFEPGQHRHLLCSDRARGLPPPAPAALSPSTLTLISFLGSPSPLLSLIHARRAPTALTEGLSISLVLCGPVEHLAAIPFGRPWRP